ncbi:dihydrofolate reductase [Liquorilactobacillus oeni]|uniref:Dihydrofolate reductase n=1 Tax=Liquorilactobacillus oeni DSM 19972 TaxID=1423777 RepID=A0A0R1MH13_9LACO|nr:dihydrofolate reductase [Liquorilactobacillus oeni]KRL04362.1 dihydrofolate reductase [Liquorilactobacillus oeni DSM 19972]
MLAYIWAEDRNHHIGIAGHLPWSLPADLAYFKKMTSNHPIAMGRKTFESLPGILPHRHHFILTRSESFAQKYKKNEQISIVHSVEELRKKMNEESGLVFIIGGASLFAQFASDVDYLYVTQIDAQFAADVTMPPLKMEDFELLSQEEGIVDKKNRYPHTFKVYRRKD